LLKATYETREINEIANMAFIAGKTNRKISNKEPTTYLPGIVKDRGEEALASQGILLTRNCTVLRTTGRSWRPAATS